MAIQETKEIDNPDLGSCTDAARNVFSGWDGSEAKVCEKKRVEDEKGSQPDVFRFARGDRARYTYLMTLTWKDHEEIAWTLLEKFPDQDPLKLSFPKLHKMVMEIEGFNDHPEGSNERVLENIQMTWYEEKKA